MGDLRFARAGDAPATAPSTRPATATVVGTVTDGSDDSGIAAVKVVPMDKNGNAMGAGQITNAGGRIHLKDWSRPQSPKSGSRLPGPWQVAHQGARQLATTANARRCAVVPASSLECGGAFALQLATAMKIRSEKSPDVVTAYKREWAAFQGAGAPLSLQVQVAHAAMETNKPIASKLRAFPTFMPLPDPDDATED